MFCYTVKGFNVFIAHVIVATGLCESAVRFEQSFCAILMFRGSRQDWGSLRRTQHTFPHFKSGMRPHHILVVADCFDIHHVAPISTILIRRW